MTKREKIINYLKDNGIDIFRSPYIEEKKEWQKSGTVVIRNHYLTDDEWCKLDDIRLDYNSPVDVKTIRVNFEWMHGYNRLIWVGKKGE